MRNKPSEQHISPIPFGESTERSAVISIAPDPENKTPSGHANQNFSESRGSNVMREVSAASSEGARQWPNFVSLWSEYFWWHQASKLTRASAS